MEAWLLKKAAQQASREQFQSTPQHDEPQTFKQFMARESESE
jgi:hypothetical protein